MEQLTDFASIVRLIKRRLVYFLLPALLIMGAGGAVVMLLPAMYRSQATILVESQQIPDELVRSTVTSLADERLQIIQQRNLSRDNLLNLARKFGLFQDKPDFTPTDIVDRIRERISVEPVNAALSGRRARQDRVVLAFTIGYEDENPQRAASVANELVTTILAEDAKTRVNQAAETTAFLNEETARLAGSLGEVERQISQFRLDNSDALPEKLSFNLSVSDKIEKSITDVDRELQSLSEQKRLLEFEARVRNVAGGTGLSPTGKSELDSKIEALRTEITAKSAIYSPNHPEMKALRRTLKALESERSGAASMAAAPGDDSQQDSGTVEPASLETQLVQEKMAALDARAVFLQKQKDQYGAALDSLKAVILKSPDVGQALAALERKRDGLQKSLDELNAKLSTARMGEKLEEDQRSERFEVIEQPIAPDLPFKPDRIKLLALVVAAALGGGGGLAFAVEFFDRRLRTSADLVNNLGLRPIAVIEYIKLDGEVRRRRWLIATIVVIGLLVLAAALAAVHFYYMPLELLQLKIVQRLGL